MVDAYIRHLGALHRLSMLAAHLPTPEDLVTGLALRVVSEYEVRAVSIHSLGDCGLLQCIASYGRPADDAAMPDVDALIAESLMGAIRRGVPTSEPWPATPVPVGWTDVLGEGHVLLLPLQMHGRPVGGLSIWMGQDPEAEHYPQFWSTLANACSLLVAWDRRWPPSGASPWRSGNPAPRLSQRQVAIMDLVALGLTNEQIGRRLGYSISTIAHDLVDVYARLGVRCREDAVLVLRQHGDVTESVLAERAVVGAWG